MTVLATVKVRLASPSTHFSGFILDRYLLKLDVGSDFSSMFLLHNKRVALHLPALVVKSVRAKCTIHGVSNDILTHSAADQDESEISLSPQSPGAPRAQVWMEALVIRACFWTPVGLQC